MWCPECNKEFPDETCPDCGVPLRERPRLSWGGGDSGVLEKWPRGEDGEPVPPVLLAHKTGFDMDDAMLMSMLEAFGIPAIRQYPGNGDFGRLMLGMSGNGVDIYVPETMLEDAIALTEGNDDD